jgi:hypothetical protein
MRGAIETQNVGAIAATVWSGEILAFEPVQSEYSPGEQVKLHIVAHAEAADVPWGAMFWCTCYEVFNGETGEKLYGDCNYHFKGPWPIDGEVDEDFVASIGPMPNSPLIAHLDFLGRTDLFGTMIFLDIAEVYIPLKGGPPPPPPGEKFPWQYFAIGGGILLGAILLSKLKGGAK